MIELVLNTGIVRKYTANGHYYHTDTELAQPSQ